MSETKRETEHVCTFDCYARGCPQVAYRTETPFAAWKAVSHD